MISNIPFPLVGNYVTDTYFSSFDNQFSDNLSNSTHPADTHLTENITFFPHNNTSAKVMFE